MEKIEAYFPEKFFEEMERIESPFPERINTNPENIETGLEKLVLTLIEFIRALMERQAMRRIEKGSLSDAEIERIGETLMKLEGKVQELKELLGLRDEDLNLNLGPLGDLL